MFPSEAEKQEYLRHTEVRLDEGRDEFFRDRVAVVDTRTENVLAWVPFDDIKALVALWVRRKRSEMDDDATLLG